MKIREIRVRRPARAPPGQAAEANELRPDEIGVHPSFAGHTDDRLRRDRQVFTNDALVRAALAVLEPLYRGENALEPER